MQKPNIARMLVGVMIAVVFILVPIVWLVWVPSPNAKSTIEIRDEANIVEVNALEKQISDIKYWQPTHVVILTLPDLAGQTLNDAVLNYARTEETEVPWINPENQNYWADSIYILAVAPNERLVGTYFGEDIKVGLETQADIQNSTKDKFREGDWAGGLVSGIESGASVMGLPPLQSTGTKIVLACMFFLGILWLFIVYIRKIRVNSYLHKGQTAYANVTRDFQATELTATLVPDSGKHGSLILQRFSIFTEDYYTLTSDFAELGTPSFISKFTPAVVRQTKALAATAEELDATDDGIVAAADFLNLRPSWRSAWEKEQGPIFEDLASLDKLVTKTAKFAGEQYLVPARALKTEIPIKLASLTTAIASGQISPEAALDELDKISLQLHSTANQVITGTIEGRKTTTEKKKFQDSWNQTDWDKHAGYRGTWIYNGHTGSYNPGSTIRPNSNTIGWSNSASTMNVPLAGLIVGYSSASTSASASDSSSSSSSSYSGGFSGSGSSSSF